jgi:hypothetical protein
LVEAKVVAVSAPSVEGLVGRATVMEDEVGSSVVLWKGGSQNLLAIILLRCQKRQRYRLTILLGQTPIQTAIRMESQTAIRTADNLSRLCQAPPRLPKNHLAFLRQQRNRRRTALRHALWGLLHHRRQHTYLHHRCRKLILLMVPNIPANTGDPVSEWNNGVR